ncbi:MAG: ExeA family protein [Chromatocurvus sp.]
MAYAFMRAEGFVMVTGRPGTGKTTLVGALVDDLSGEKVTTANIVCSQLEASDLLQMVAYEFGVDVVHTEKGVLLQHLSRLLQKWHREGRRALLIVDEAQDLSVSAMEELRLLTNIQVAGKPLLQIFLLGQPDLRELILSPPLEQVHQRIVAASHLEALEMDETEAYVRHRLTLVGWRGDPDISRAIYPLIYKFSEGVPRRINLICSRLLLHGSVEQLHRLSVADMKEVLSELQGESLAAGNQLVENDFQVDDVFEASNTPLQGETAARESVGRSPARNLRDVASRSAGGAEDSTDPAEEPEPANSGEAPRATGTGDVAAAMPEQGSGDKDPKDSSSAWRRRMRRNNRIF